MIRLDEDPKKPKGLYHDEELMWVIYEVAEASKYATILTLEQAAATEPTVWADLFTIRSEVDRQYNIIDGEKGADQSLPDIQKSKDPRTNRVKLLRR